jgi:4,5-dihydroxyphthalate decarboxylase
MSDDPLASSGSLVAEKTLTVACGDFDRTRRLLDGTIGIEGYKLKFLTMPPEDMFRRAFEGGEFDISELSASTFLLHVGRGSCPYVGLPLFPSRAFRHAAIYVRAGGGITKPQDLRDRVVGVRSYLNTAALVVRGLFADEYGVASDEISWRIGDVDAAERKTIPVPRLEKPADLQALPYGKTLTGELLTGGIDALIHYNPPRGFDHTAASPFRRLFPDPAAAERAYFEKTRIFPIMHLVGVRRPLLAQDPSLAGKVYAAFARAKDLAMADLTAQSSPKLSLPWLNDDVERTVALAGTDFWPYGVGKNADALASLTRYAFAQGLTNRPLALAELFDPSLLET